MKQQHAGAPFQQFDRMADSSITQRFGEQPGLLAATLDVTNEVQGVAVVKAAIEHFGRIDVLVNNAGFGVLGAVEETIADEVRRVYETNVFGLLNVTRAVLPHMRAARRGHVINLSSVGGYTSGPGFGVYCSTKFAVEGLSEALHAELEPLGIKVILNQSGDPDKLAQAMITLVEAQKAPLRLPLGSDCVAAIEAKNTFVADELQTWRELSVSTDF
ncbi:SDR family NAD(P)-dependent oxidoreductase [Pseudomonas sp. MDT1-16]